MLHIWLVAILNKSQGRDLITVEPANLQAMLATQFNVSFGLSYALASSDASRTSLPDLCAAVGSIRS